MGNWIKTLEQRAEGAVDGFIGHDESVASDVLPAAALASPDGSSQQTQTTSDGKTLDDLQNELRQLREAQTQPETHDEDEPAPASELGAAPEQQQ